MISVKTAVAVVPVSKRSTGILNVRDEYKKNQDIRPQVDTQEP